MTARHTEAFIEQALVKALSRGSRTITLVAEELNLSHHTLSSWMKKKSALAEAAALLVLQKKFRALWEDEEK